MEIEDFLVEGRVRLVIYRDSEAPAPIVAALESALGTGARAVWYEEGEAYGFTVEEAIEQLVLFLQTEWRSDEHADDEAL